MEKFFVSEEKSFIGSATVNECNFLFKNDSRKTKQKRDFWMVFFGGMDHECYTF